MSACLGMYLVAQHCHVEVTVLLKAISMQASSGQLLQVHSFWLPALQYVPCHAICIHAFGVRACSGLLSK